MRQTTPHNATSPSVSSSANAQSPAKRTLYTPRKFTRRTKARFAADRTAELTRHLARDLSFPERIIVGRVIALEWDLRRIDAKMDQGEELSGHMMRARLAAETRLRLDLAQLGMKPAAPRQPTLAEHLARLAAEKGAAA